MSENGGIEVRANDHSEGDSFDVAYQALLKQKKSFFDAILSCEQKGDYSIDGEKRFLSEQRSVLSALNNAKAKANGSSQSELVDREFSEFTDHVNGHGQWLNARWHELTQESLDEAKDIADELKKEKENSETLSRDLRNAQKRIEESESRYLGIASLFVALVSLIFTNISLLFKNDLSIFLILIVNCSLLLSVVVIFTLLQAMRLPSNQEECHNAKGKRPAKSKKSAPPVLIICIISAVLLFFLLIIFSYFYTKTPAASGSFSSASSSTVSSDFSTSISSVSHS